MRKSLLPITTIVLILAGVSSADAMPMFARKLNVPCGNCHTTIPRLSELGYRFREAGFRMPDDIGKPEAEPYTIENPVIDRPALHDGPRGPRAIDYFTLLSEPTVYRWPVFDNGGSVSWYSSGSQPG